MSITSWLSAREATNPSAIEKYVCKPFYELPCQLTDEVKAYHFGMISLSPKVSFEGFKKWQLTELTEHQLLYLSVRLDDRSLIFLNMVSEQVSEGKILLAYIQYWAKLHKARAISYPTLKKEVFKNGFPDKAEINTLWGNQKVDVKESSENLLDYKIPYRSILF